MSSNNLINNTLLTNIPKPNKSLRSLDAGPTETLEVLLEPLQRQQDTDDTQQAIEWGFVAGAATSFLGRGARNAEELQSVGGLLNLRLVS